MQYPAKRKRHIQAVFLALLVTFLWSTSWVLIKIGLKSDLPPVTFAGLRYTLAFLCLIPFITVNPSHRSALKNIPGGTWRELVLLGILFYTLTQGAQFVGLAFLPAATLTLLLNLTPVIVALFGSTQRQEHTTLTQWSGIIISIAGVLIYFLPQAIPTSQWIGLLAGAVGLLANAGSSIFGRFINSQGTLHPVIVTSVSMGIGGVLLLLTGILAQGWEHLALSNWLIVGWLALVNTAFAFTLWNKTLQTLTAVESSLINGTMLPQIAILAWIFLGESLGIRQIVGLCLVTVGTLIVQMWRYREFRKDKKEAPGEESFLFSDNFKAND